LLRIDQATAWIIRPAMTTCYGVEPEATNIEETRIRAGVRDDPAII